MSAKIPTKTIKLFKYGEPRWRGTTEVEIDIAVDQFIEWDTNHEHKPDYPVWRRLQIWVAQVLHSQPDTGDWLELVQAVEAEIDRRAS